jgi:glutathione S-transferase
MPVVAAVVIAAVLQFFWFGILVGRARTRYQVPPPATTGNEVFERYFRVQQNTLEQLVIFIPSIWTFATYVSATWAAVLGSVFVVGRQLYQLGYVADPKKRFAGFGLSALPNLVLALGGLAGAVAAAF